MIEIVEETNPDWWTGKINGRQALFPSSYVEKVASPSAAAMPTPATATNGRTLPPAFSAAKEKPAYRPFAAAHQSANAPPPNVPVNNVGLQAGTVLPPFVPFQVLVLMLRSTDIAGQEQKKSKYGKYGNTMAHSAAGGVGFGAGPSIFSFTVCPPFLIEHNPGSAIGGGLVRAIF